MTRSEHYSADVDMPLLYVVSVLCIPSLLFLSKLLHPQHIPSVCVLLISTTWFFVGFVWFWGFGFGLVFIKVDLSESDHEFYSVVPQTSI